MPRASAPTPSLPGATVQASLDEVMDGLTATDDYVNRVANIVLAAQNDAAALREELAVLHLEVRCRHGLIAVRVVMTAVLQRPTLPSSASPSHASLVFGHPPIGVSDAAAKCVCDVLLPMAPTAPPITRPSLFVPTFHIGPFEDFDGLSRADVWALVRDMFDNLQNAQERLCPFNVVPTSNLHIMIVYLRKRDTHDSAIEDWHASEFSDITVVALIAYVVNA